MSVQRLRGADLPVPAGVRVHALVPAAGRSERFGGETPKQFLEIGGRPLLAWTIERLLAADCATIVVALPEELSPDSATRLASDSRVSFVVGGATRQESVSRALAASVATAEEWVAVHDGARAALDPADFAATLAAAELGAGAILGRLATDTTKELNESGHVVRTLSRERLFRAETPQIFRRRLLEQALAAAARDGRLASDEAALVEQLGEGPIVAVSARHPNPKVTFPEDLAWVGRFLLADEWR